MARPINERVNTHLQAALDGLEKEKAQIEDQIRGIRSVLGQATAAAAVAKAAPAAEASSPAAADSGTGVRRKKRRKLSAEARARIAAAQKKRWADFRKSGS